MSGIGGIINTSRGPAQVVAILPGNRDESGRRLSQVVTTPLTGDGCQTGPGGKDLSQTEQQRLKELQDADRAVKTEERHHAAVAGAYGSAPQYKYIQGPDGKYYAVAGKVDVGVPANASPEQAAKAQKAIAAAATSVSTPSSADFNASAQASRMAAQAYGQAQNGQSRPGLFDFSA